jgi:hypothetical protein
MTKPANIVEKLLTPAYYRTTANSLLESSAAYYRPMFRSGR